MIRISVVNEKKCILAALLLTIFLSPIQAAETNPLEDLKNEKAAKTENPLLEEARKQNKRPKNNNVIYQWVDENGKTIISDVPHEGAIEIKLPQPQTYTAPKIKATSEDNVEEQKQSNFLEKYNSAPPKLKIISPANDSWLDNNQGNLQVNVAVVPLLRPGQTLLIKLDDKEISRGQLSQINLQGLDRGTHNLLVEVQLTKSKKIKSEKLNLVNSEKW